MSAQPGWYQDPRGDTRYWDGQTWTDVVVSPVSGQAVRVQARPWSTGPRRSLLASICVLLGADIVLGVSVVVAAVDPSVRAFLEAEDSSDLVLDGGRLALVTLAGLAGLVWYAAILVSGILAMAWTWQVRVNAEALTPMPHSLPRAWAWAGWITPIVSLWFPNQVIREVDRADKQALAALVDPARPKAPVNAWWVGYLGYWMIGQAAGGFPSFGVGHITAYLLSSLAGVAGLVLFWRVTRVVEDDQRDASRARLGPAATAVPTPSDALVAQTA